MGGRNDKRVCLEGGRLVYYRPNMGRCFWDEHWRACNSPQFYVPYSEDISAGAAWPRFCGAGFPAPDGYLKPDVEKHSMLSPSAPVGMIA